jgi:hypothetical protein
MSKSRDKALKSDGHSPPTEELPFRVELWHDGGGDAVERVLARAVSAQLARAIFKAAQGDHPERRITLRRGSRIIADSAK